MLKNVHSEKYLIEQMGSFSTSLIKPWQLQEIIKEKSKTHHYKIFCSITKIRLLLVSFLFFISLSFNSDTILLTSTGLYAIITAFLLAYLLTNKLDIYKYALFYALLDILILGYIFTKLGTDNKLGIIFLIIIFNSILLPLLQLILTAILSIIFILTIYVWETIGPNGFNIFFSQDTTINISRVFGIRNKLEETFILIIGIFIISILTNRLAKWSMISEVKAQLKNKQVQQLLSFNKSVIEHLKNGVLVFTGNADIISINQRTIELLGINKLQTIINLSDLSDTLLKKYQYWEATLLGTERSDDSFSYCHNKNTEEVFISFSKFGEKEQDNIFMMTIESVNKNLQNLQQAKLSALGRLTAGIAHEIRNPLSSINSAAQLLDENSNSAEQKKLSKIILANVQRTNQVIKDILGLFKDNKSKKELLPVNKTLKRFCNNFSLSNKEDKFKIIIKSNTKEDLYFRVYPVQLEQILWNLSSNAIRCAFVDNLEITIQYNLSKNRKILYLIIYDNGIGIEEKVVYKIFEPFYTSNTNGSGLGLYLARELCNINNASISYLLPKDRDKTLPKIGACFKITIPVYLGKDLKL